MGKNMFKAFGAQLGSFEGSDNKFNSNPDFFKYFNTKVGESAIIRVVPFPPFEWTRCVRMVKGVPRTIRSTAGTTVNGGKCVGAYWAAKSKAAKYNSDKEFGNPVQMGDVSTITVFDFRKVHTFKNDDGRDEEKMCKGERCMLCEEGMVPQYRGQKHWTLGSAHYGVFTNTHLKIGERCLSCKEGKIAIKDVVCAKCGEPIFSKDQLVNATDKDLQKKLFMEFTCGSCGHKDLPEEEIACSECNDPVRASITDTNLEIEKVPGQKNEKYSTLTISPTYKFEPIPEDVKNMCKKFSFEEIWPYYSLDVQASMLGVPNPWAGESNTEQELSEGVTEEEAEKDIWK